MKKLALLFGILLFSLPLRAQTVGTPSNPFGGDIRASSAACATAASCVWQKLPSTATTLTATITGTFVATLQFEQSSDGITFAAASPASTSTTGVTTFTVTSFTDFRVRASAYVSGTASVNLQASGNQLSVTVNTGGSSVSPNSPVPAAQAQGPQYNIKNYGAIGDAKKTITAVTSNPSSTVTDATNSPWLATDVGKNIYCIGFGGNSALTPTMTTITGFTSASSITVGATGNGNAQAGSFCVWFTQKDKTAMLAANTAAIQALKGIRPFLGPTLAYPGAVYCPPGGYVVDGPFFVQNSANGNTLGVSFIGAGKSSCTIYVSPDVAVASNSWMLNSTQNTGMTFSDFTVDCSLQNMAPAAPGMNFNTNGNWNLKNVEIDGCGTTGDAQGLVRLNSNTNLIVDHLTINNAPTVTPTAEPPIALSGGSFITIRNLYTTNPGPVPLVITTSGGQAFAGGPRSTVQGAVFIENSVIDEGGNPVVLNITNGSTVNIKGSSFFEGITGGIAVDGTSSLYIDSSHIAPFGGTCSGGNRNALQLVAGSAVYSTGTTYESCGADGTGLSAAVKGPVTATFASLGGNDYRNCPGGPPCPAVTAANYTTLGFNGGIVPKSSETHTPNTCYAVTGNLLATAQNLCTFLNDQNYQVLNITAQSGGTTPANSACATPPVITLSDGTRTATLTMTTAKTQWSSAVDASTVGAVFATGTTLTISIGANTCATPPVNVAVSYVLQSVLNP